MPITTSNELTSYHLFEIIKLRTNVFLKLSYKKWWPLDLIW